jgi:DNA-binding transcriptional ArsR family regulator
VWLFLSRLWRNVSEQTTNPESREALSGEMASLCRALAHPSRIGILQNLRDGARSVTQLQRDLKLRQPVVSQHLALLRSERLVKTERSGRQVLYQLAHPEVVAWIERCLPLISRTMGPPLMDSALPAARTDPDSGRSNSDTALEPTFASSGVPLAEDDDCF